jgi:hypothetical protein
MGGASAGLDDTAVSMAFQGGMDVSDATSKARRRRSRSTCSRTYSACSMALAASGVITS